MAFLPTTVEALRDKLASLEEDRATHKADVDHYTDLVAKYQAKYDAANAAVKDYTSLLECAEGRTPRPSKPSAVRLLASLTPTQRKGNACLICGVDITIDEPDQLSAEIDGTQLFIHVDPKVCTRELARQLSEEVPF